MPRKSRRSRGVAVSSRTTLSRIAERDWRDRRDWGGFDVFRTPNFGSRLSRISHASRFFSILLLSVGPRPPKGAPVRSPIVAWTHHVGTDTEGHVFSGPNLHTLDVDDGIGIVRFIQWQRDGTGDLAGHGDSGPWWEGRGLRNSRWKAMKRPCDWVNSYPGRADRLSGSCRISILVPSFRRRAVNTSPPKTTT